MTVTGEVSAGASAPPALAGVRTADAGDEIAHRGVGWMVALGGAFLAVGAARSYLEQRAGFATWWTVPAVALALAPLAAAVTGPWLETRTLRRFWAAYPLALLAVLATWGLARSDPATGDVVGPWAWQLEAAAAGFVAVVRPFRVAAGYVLLSVLTVLAAATVADGRVPGHLAAAAPAHLASVLFAAMCAALCRVPAAARDAEARLAARAALLSRERAAQVERSRLATLVHDEVLTTLNLAARAETPLSGSLVAQARAARDALLNGGRPAAESSVTAAELVARVRERVAAHSPGLAVAERVESAEQTDQAERTGVPSDVAEAVLAALDEAVRNSVRHAAGQASGRPVTRSVDVLLREAGLLVTVRDDGVGFDVAALDPRRLGVRRSIVARMAALPGGSASIRSAPGAGTVVTLGWRRP